MLKPLAACFSLAVTAGLFAQDVPMSVPDQSDPNKGNFTTQSETNHAVTPNAVIGVFNDASDLAVNGTLSVKRIGWRSSTNGGITFSGGGLFEPSDGALGRRIREHGTRSWPCCARRSSDRPSRTSIAG